MQIVLSNNRIVGYGENFLCMGGTVINTATGAKYDNATIAECDCVPSDIGRVGYEYHAGTFVPCAPFGKADNTGYIMEVCTNCATPRNSGVPVKNAKWETVSTLHITELLATSNAEKEKNFSYDFDIDFNAHPGYSEYRKVIKGGTIETINGGAYMTGYSPYVTIGGAVNMTGLTSGYDIPSKCMAQAGYILPQGEIDVESGVESWSITENVTGFDIKVGYCNCNIDLIVELQFRG